MLQLCGGLNIVEVLLSAAILPAIGAKRHFHEYFSGRGAAPPAEPRAERVSFRKPLETHQLVARERVFI
jgi:hypothetical protein